MWARAAGSAGRWWSGRERMRPGRRGDGVGWRGVCRCDRLGRRGRFAIGVGPDAAGRWGWSVLGDHGGTAYPLRRRLGRLSVDVGPLGVDEDGASAVEPAPVGDRIGDELRTVVEADVGRSSFSSLASSAFIPPYWLRQRWQVDSVISRRRKCGSFGPGLV